MLCITNSNQLKSKQTEQIADENFLKEGAAEDYVNVIVLYKNVKFVAWLKNSGLVINQLFLLRDLFVTLMHNINGSRFCTTNLNL